MQQECSNIILKLWGPEGTVRQRAPACNQSPEAVPNSFASLAAARVREAAGRCKALRTVGEATFFVRVGEGLPDHT